MAPQTLFMDSPNAIRVTSEGFDYEIFRISLPVIRDIPCDLANPMHGDLLRVIATARAPLSAAKAQYWQTQAEHAQKAAKMRAFNAKNARVTAMANALMARFFMYVGDDTEGQREAEAKARADAFTRSRILAEKQRMRTSEPIGVNDEARALGHVRIA